MCNLKKGTLPIKKGNGINSQTLKPNEIIKINSVKKYIYLQKKIIITQIN